MSYTAALEQLSAMAPELFTGAGHERRKFSLDQMRVLLGALGDPQRHFRSVLVAGTNGKGSTAATLASILTVAGVRTGLYTSPHLVRPNERIRVGDREIDDEAFGALFARVQQAAQALVQSGQLPQIPSYFEFLTALGFLHFAEQHVELAVLEVGMGGRLDATNVVDPLLSVITDISLDHMEWLGSTVGAIAKEKAGILRSRGTMVTLPQHPEANQALGEVAVALDVRGVNAAEYMPGMGSAGHDAYTLEVLGEPMRVDSPLAGAHQHRNLALAIAAAVELKNVHGFLITPAAIAEGIRATRWPGRLERIAGQGVQWVLDVAHNPAGAWALRAGLRGLLDDDMPRELVFSCLRDKPIRELAQILFPLFDRVILAPIHSARAASMEDLLAAAESTGTPAYVAASIPEALALAQTQGQGGVAVVAGSVYLVGEARGLLLAAGSEQP